ncbi:NADH-ubiquinone oxidoreductase subunit B17.2,putative [Schistosoma mansoni]|uniref:NADH dehydrogenase [ubiquinone] 1 alpha subcomplex subunit 12 n=1 Tax=Schistosoma mansoni TaxID=6183 RepID=G4LYT5_SCHMA|nr:NADH-ubiquinone oxidoreductase subunit B17.2,putative [Schistosoma mansoni]|eukprot:XP_018646412.1 NADH-ubiquinone oxidoreductase subunit B17.2,putative [Schistosoma mansoni]
MSLIEKLNTLRLIIRQNGGIKGSFLTLFRTDELKWGKLVGTDNFGNKYYENNNYFVGRNRWVIYSNRFGWDYEGSQVPPEWHRWLHYMTDENPVSNPPTVYKWYAEHSENLTLEKEKKYIPYSTTRPKIEPWEPPK